MLQDAYLAHHNFLESQYSMLIFILLDFQLQIVFVLPIADLSLVLSLKLGQIVPKFINLDTPLTCKFRHFVETLFNNLVLSHRPLPLLLQQVHPHLVVSYELILQHIDFILFLQIEVRAVEFQSVVNQLRVYHFRFLVQYADVPVF